ncbi:MAG: hypothetical protein QNJ14_03830 [Woeseiaceae bacterium]|nr:hypothetical protein [Woeseiaceae bacterium]
MGATSGVRTSPRLQLSVLYQQNSVGDLDNWNARLSWEYRPLSYVYLVYNHSESSDLSAADDSPTEQVILKFTYLFEV